MEKVALSLVGSIVSPIFSKLENTAFSYFGGDITKEELQHLQNIILPKIKAGVMAAEARDVDVLKPWLMTLKATAYEAEDVLDMYEYQRLEAQVSSVPKCLKVLDKKAREVAAPFSLKTSLKKSVEKLKVSAAEIDPFIPLVASFTGQDPTNQQRRRQQQHESVSSPSSPVIGRDHERDSIVDTLISAANDQPGTNSGRRIPVLAIYGIGGAGKTTLAQWIYDDSRVAEHFGTKMWVHVSRKFDKHTVTKKVIEHLQRDECPRVENFDALQSILKGMLRSRSRFLLVLDDVWRLEDKEQWDQTLIPFNEVGDTGSRILITCRAEEVTSMLGVNHSFPLAELNEEDYRSIFKHYSFGDANKVVNDPQLLVVANDIVKKLNRSPLAARVVGSLLRRKPAVDDWKQTLKRGDMLKDTLGALYWSFEHLPPYLQRCFAFCSLYPKGYIFSKLDDFVRLWIAQGFVEVPNNEDTVTLEDEATRYFNELLSNSFFQKNVDSYGRAYYGMHDLLHDLAEEVSKDYCFRIEDDCERIPANAMHLSVASRDISSHIPDIFKLVNLRTFVVVSLSDNPYFSNDLGDLSGVVKKVCMKFRKLRVLHLGLGYNGVLKLDNKSVGRLKHLRSFQMGEVSKLPKSLGGLYHLQFLVFRRASDDHEVPQSLNNLINLRYIRGGNVTISKIPRFGKLTSLQAIDRYQASRERRLGIGQLKGLQQLRGSLRIYSLENVRDKAEASEASLREKKHVDKLELEWKRSSERDGRMDEEVLQGLQPPPNLSVLKLDGYNGVGLPKWTRNGGSHFLDLERLHELLIVNCHNLLQVPPLPTMLGRLVIWGCANLSEVPLLPLGLRALTVHGCPKLVQSQPRLLHNLEELDLEDCGGGGVETMLSSMSLLCNGEDGSSSIQGIGFVLRRMRIARCSSIRDGEKELCPDKLTSLTHLTLTELPWLTSLRLGRNLTALEYVKIESCENLRSIGNSLGSIFSLKFLHITNCPRLTVEQRHQQPDNRGGVVEFLSVAGCPELTSLWSLNCFTSLRVLSVTGCPKLTIKPGEDSSLSQPPPPPPLQTVTIDDLSLLTALPRRECLNSISSLTVEKSTQDKPFTAEQEELFQHLTSLTSLKFNSCERLPSLPANLEKLSSLKSLYIWGCPKVESLPNLPASLEPEQVDIHRCHPQLQRK